MSFTSTQKSDVASTYPIHMHASSTGHFHPMRSFTNQVLVNKEKLNQDIRSMESFKMLPVKEKIYYNPKFLINHVKTAANAYISSSNEQSINENKPTDTKILINRNYLANLNLSNYTQSNDAKPQGRSGIYINPKFINRQSNLIKDESNISRTISNQNDIFNSNILLLTNSILKKSVTTDKSNFKPNSSSKSKYKFIKTIASPQKSQISPKPLCIKTKYSLKRLNVVKCFNKESTPLKSPHILKIKTTKTSPELKTKLVRKASSEFKKLSSTKLVRKSVLQSLILARRHTGNKLFRKFTYTLNKKIPKKKSTHISYFQKIKNHKVPPYEIYKKDNVVGEKYKKINNIMNLKTENICNSSFKKMGKMKIVRKSLLKAQIEARNQVKKQYLRDYRNWMEFYTIKDIKFNTRNDSIRRKYVVNQKALLKWRKKKVPPPDTSRAKCKRASHASNSKHFRKNNQPCPFYNRFGRCKGKDKGTCPKLHDTLYISICRKLLQGECNSKDCLLSHDIRPGKMPTCHHYLAGLCTRTNCPYLHIKVNPKAPICTAFLQGFCPDVFNCLKRHEFICPIFAEKGNCPRGKSCTYPHRSPVVHSKLLKDDQKPLIKRTTDSLINTINESKEVSELSKTKTKLNSKSNKKIQKEYVKEAFTRYFAVTNSDETSDNSVGSKETVSSPKDSTKQSS